MKKLLMLSMFALLLSACEKKTVPDTVQLPTECNEFIATMEVVLKTPGIAGAPGIPDKAGWEKMQSDLLVNAKKDIKSVELECKNANEVMKPALERIKSLQQK